MINRNSEMPRNLKFQEQTIRNFVQSSSFLNTTSAVKENLQVNSRVNMAQTMNNFQSKPKGYDYYSRRNLLLSSCNAEDIQYIRKNPIVFEQQIVIPHQPATTKNIKIKESPVYEAKSKTASNFYHPENKQEQGNKISKQAEMNQFLFNYRKNQEEKKNKKLKFLQEVEERINKIQKEAVNLQSEKEKQFEEINGMLQIHSQATQFAKKAEMVGKLNSALYELEGEGKRVPSPRKITEDMGLLQINAAIEEHREYNDALLNEVERVSRSKSKERVKYENRSESIGRKTGMKKVNMDDPPQTSLSRTLKRPNGVPPKPSSSKKLTSTWKGKS